MGAEMAGVIEQTGKPRGNLKNYMDPSLTNKKDQMNKKQAILDELQKVERELQASGKYWATGLETYPNPFLTPSPLYCVFTFCVLQGRQDCLLPHILSPLLRIVTPNLSPV